MKYLLFLNLFFCFLAQGQNRNSIWCFGDSAGIDFSDVSNPSTFSTSIRSKGTCSSIADSTGDLLFYVGNEIGFSYNNGVVWNRNHQVMPNGQGLFVSHWYHGAMITTYPNNSNLYYIFQNVITAPIPGIYYSIVDMGLDSGNGSVVQKNVLLFNGQTADGIGGVKHANGRDWWVIFPRWIPADSTNEFYLYLVTPLGISAPIIKNLGAKHSTNSFDITFSTDGSKMVVSTLPGLIEIMDFDRCNGEFSNIILVEPATPGILTLASNSISSNKSVLYIISTGYTSYLFQYDLTASPINLSKDTIAEFLWPHDAAGTLRMAEDGKVYLSNVYNNFIQYIYPYADSMYNNYNMNLSVINFPDGLGSACDFQPYSFYLGGKRTYYGLPNNPNYELGTIAGSVCDSLIGIDDILKGNEFIIVVPNPSSGKFIFKIYDKSERLSKNCTVTIIDISGRTLLIENLGIVGEEFRLDLSSFSKGIYFVNVDFNGRNQWVKLILD